MRRQYVVRVERGGEGTITTASVADGGIILPVPRPRRELGD